MTDTLKRLLDNATPRPWKAANEEQSGENWHVMFHAGQTDDGKKWHVSTDGIRASQMLTGDAKSDCELVAYLANNAPKLLELWEAAEKFSPFAPIVALEIYRQQARTAGTDWDENKERQIIIAADNLVDALNALKEQELNDELPRP